MIPGAVLATTGTIGTGWALMQADDHAMWAGPAALVMFVGVALLARRPAPAPAPYDWAADEPMQTPSWDWPR